MADKTEQLAIWSSLAGGRRPSNPLEMWISMFPTAPLFGIRWAFWDAAGAGFMDGSALTAMAAQAAAPVAAVEAAPVETARARAAADREAEKLAQHGAVARLVVGGSDAGAATEEKPAARRLRLVETPKVEVGPEPQPKRTDDAALGPRKPKGLHSAPPKRIDDLKRIKGVGAKLEAVLNDLGVYTFAQIVKFGPRELAWLDERLGAFKGRAVRDGWMDQAQALIDEK